MNHLNFVRSYGRLVFLYVLAFGHVAHGWVDHFRITEEATAGMVDELVTFEPLDSALARGLADFPVKNGHELKTFLKINRTYDFPSKLAETPTAKISAKRILAIYSDEPDWGADRELFTADQYPDLWQPDTKYIAGKTGPSSQGFRHMYFPGHFIWSSPIASFQVPMHPLGEAPARVRLYLDLAKSFFRAGARYWGYRFLGWAVHYPEDLYQPFHVSQTPSKKMIVLDWTKWIPAFDIPETSEQITYYHFGYEWWQSEQMKKADDALSRALHTNDPHAATEVGQPVEAYALNVIVPFSWARAGRVGKANYRLFPPLPPRSGQKAVDVVGKPDWVARIAAGQEGELTNVTAELFRAMGETVRAIVREGSQITAK